MICLEEEDNDLSGSVSGACLDPPSAQSLFAQPRRYLVRRGVRLGFKTSPLLSQRQSKLYKETVIGSAYPPVINLHTLCAAASPAQWRESMRRVRERSPLLRSYRLMRQTKVLLSPSVFPIATGLCRLLSVPAGRWPFPTLSP